MAGHLPGLGFESLPESLSCFPGNETNLPRIGFVYLQCFASRARRPGGETCMEVLVTSAEYHDRESSFHDLKGF